MAACERWRGEESAVISPSSHLPLSSPCLALELSHDLVNLHAFRVLPLFHAVSRGPSVRGKLFLLSIGSGESVPSLPEGTKIRTRIYG